MAKRKSLSISTRMSILHESGYKCSNPTCRTIITLDLHHLDYVSNSGKNEPENLLALCPNCHTLHHKGFIPIESLRAWKMIQLSLNEAFDKRTIDLLLTISKQKHIDVSGEGVLVCAPLIGAGFAEARMLVGSVGIPAGGPKKAIYRIQMTPKGILFVDAWKNGNQKDAIIRNIE